ncbi:AAA family ATPase [Leekyejoonella antrihumi]|uniref:AAA family ATPase n=1 Tax=Leekyejoonella antrihumi TaxID=1660198 RepID=UPI0016447141|nr:AAA family ATPase [Leekyejoonella antrihumi]
MAGAVGAAAGMRVRVRQMDRAVYLDDTRFEPGSGRLVRSGEAILLRPKTAAPRRPFVGRETDLAALARLWAQALGGRRGVGFVGGQAGVGKTALVDQFVQRLPRNARPLVGQGRVCTADGAR